MLHKTMTDVFKLEYGVDFVCIVNRRRHGNGYNKTLVERIIEEDTRHHIDVIVSADHGASNETEFAILKKYDIDLIITDHHTVPYDHYPKSADVFVNNQRKESTYTKNVSGCCVAFLTMMATYDKLYGTIDIEKFYPLLPYVAITTISDVMSLKDPYNRQIVQYGLRELNSLRNPLWLYMKKILGIPSILTSKDIGFKIAPLINTASRTNCEDSGYGLLIADNIDDMTKHMKVLMKNSTIRKKEQKLLLIEAEQQALHYPHDDTLVIALKSKLAINGIIAGNVGETYSKPTVCFIINEGSDTTTGSGRGVINGYNIRQVFKKINDEHDGIIIKYGGHTQAAGCSIRLDKLDEFKELFDKYTKEQLDSQEIDTKVYVDALINGEDISPSLVSEILRLEPYGKNWEAPVFSSVMNLKYFNIYGNMVRFVFKTMRGREIEAMHFFNSKSSFSKHDIYERLDRNRPVIVTYNVTLNNFNNRTNLQLSIIDVQNIKD